MLMPQALFIRLGGFDVSYFMYTEETDLCYRARSEGYPVMYFPGAEVTHLEGGSVTRKSDHFRQVLTSQLHFIDTHFRGMKWLFCTALKYVGMVNRVIAYMVVGALTADSALMRKSGAFLRALF